MAGPAIDMMRPAGHAVRAARSVTVALVCTATAVLAHLSAGGTMPDLAVPAVFGGATAVAWLLSARRVTPGQMVGLLILCQVVVHLGCSTGDMTMSVSMIAAHVAATAISGAALARGEAFVWLLAERLGIRLAPLRASATPFPCGPLSLPVVTTRSLHDVRLAHSRVERGPPNGS